MNPAPPARLAVRVQPGARRDALVARLASGEWKLAVSAPPEAGRANEAVAELLATLLGVRRRQVSVVRGHASRGKQVDVTGLSGDEAESRLSAALARTKGHDGE
jgi:hypothetical protein